MTMIGIYVLLIGWCGIRWGVLLDRFVYDICPCCCIVDCSSWYSQVSVCRFVFLNNCCVRLWCVVVVTAICCAGVCVFLKCLCWKCACVRCVLLCACVLDVAFDTKYEECYGLLVLLSCCCRWRMLIGCAPVVVMVWYNDVVVLAVFMFIEVMVAVWLYCSGVWSC